jgi:uncharacterized membrane protein YkoI
MTKKIVAIATATAIAVAGGVAVASAAKPAPGTGSALRALDTASDVGRPYDLERERRKWEIDVTPHTELTISSGGRRIVGRKSAGASDDASRARDASVSMAAAVRTADRRATGRLEGAELDRERGRLVWSVDFERGSLETEVEVDAKSGDVVRVTKERDD